MLLQDENDPNQELRPEQLAQPLMTKHQAKEVLAVCMPVHEAVLAHHVRTVATMAVRVTQKRQERIQVRGWVATWGCSEQGGMMLPESLSTTNIHDVCCRMHCCSNGRPTGSAQATTHHISRSSMLC